MIVQFHVLQEHTETKEPRHEPLYTQEWGFITVGQTTTLAGVIYRVDSLEWIDQKAGVLKAVCLVVPSPATHTNRPI